MTLSYKAVIVKKLKLGEMSVHASKLACCLVVFFPFCYENS